MEAYESLQTARQQLSDAIEAALVRIGQHRFASRYTDRLRGRFNRWLGTPVYITVGTDQLSFSYQPYRETMTDVCFDGRTVELQRSDGDDTDESRTLLRDVPETLDGIAEAVTELWRATFDTPCPHADAIAEARHEFAVVLETGRLDATLDDLLEAIREQDLEFVELLFDVDDPLPDQEDTELAALFDRPVERIVYRDDDLALLKLVSERGFTGWWRPAPVEEAYVVGVDDTPSGFFVHPVDGTNLRTGSTVTRTDVHGAMGFDRSLDRDTDVLDADPGERVRVQGDLCVEYTRDADAMRERLADQQRADVERTVTDEFVDRYFRERGLQSHRDAVTCTGRGTDVQVRIPYSSTRAETVEAIERTCGIAARSAYGATRDLDHRDRLARATARLERRLANYTAAREEEFATVVDAHVEQRVHEELDEPQQLNLSIDNHLVIFGSARVHPTDRVDAEPVSVLVPEATSLHVLHDEHPQIDLHVSPGEYSVGLLDRGVQPVANRPDW